MCSKFVLLLIVIEITLTYGKSKKGNTVGGEVGITKHDKLPKACAGNSKATLCSPSTVAKAGGSLGYAGLSCTDIQVANDGFDNSHDLENNEGMHNEFRNGGTISHNVNDDREKFQYRQF